jgi:hypothetical protein
MNIESAMWLKARLAKRCSGLDLVYEKSILTGEASIAINVLAINIKELLDLLYLFFAC